MVKIIWRCSNQYILSLSIKPILPNTLKNIFFQILCQTLRLLGFPDSSVGKEFACNAGDSRSIHGLRRSPGEGKGYPLQYSGLENSMDYTVHGVAKSRTQLSNFHLTKTLVILEVPIHCVGGFLYFPGRTYTK